MPNLNQKIVIAKLPKAGLGNKLYIWAKAAIFSQVNNCNYYALGWTRPSLGSFLRKEKSNRLYLGQFCHQGIGIYFKLITKYLTSKPVIEPNLNKFPQDENNLFVFNKITGVPDDSFKDFLAFRGYLKSEIRRIITNKVREIIFNSPVPIIGIHVRRGDFKFTPWLTPIEYFRFRLIQIRQVAGIDLPATIFSDGSIEELSPLLNLPNVILVSNNPEIVDMILLSLSRILITCPASTFSNWASFLSEDSNIIIRSPLFIHKPVREPEVNAKYYEGVVGDDISEWSETLIKNIKNIASVYESEIC